MLAIPMASLFGVLIAYGRLSEDNEITAMKSTGTDYASLSMPVVITVCVISCFLLFFNHFWSPKMHTDFRNLYEEILIKRPLVTFAEKSIVKLGQYQIYANKANNADNSLSGVNIYKFEENQNQTDENSAAIQTQKASWRIAASSASVKVYPNGAGLTLYNGYWQMANPSDINKMVHMTFQSYSFFIPLGETSQGHTSSLREMQSPELSKTIKEYKAKNFPYTAYEIEFWVRWIFALAPISFILIALPIGIMSGKGGKTIGFGMSLGVILAYYMLLIVSMNLAERNYAPAFIIMWLPNAATAAAGLYLCSKMVKR
jgi:lipopolysaccharide export LptBFGC system permease protein LptF